jgi:hypothetical protein
VIPLLPYQLLNQALVRPWLYTTVRILSFFIPAHYPRSTIYKIFTAILLDIIVDLASITTQLVSGNNSSVDPSESNDLSNGGRLNLTLCNNMSSLYQILERCKELDAWGCPMDPDKLDFFSVFAEKHKSLRMCGVLAQKYHDQPRTLKLLFPFVSLSILDCLLLLTHYFRDLILLFLDKQTAYGRAKFHCTPYKSGVRWRR